MKKLVALFILFLGFMVSYSTYAAGGWYGQGQLGAGAMHTKNVDTNDSPWSEEDIGGAAAGLHPKFD